MNEVVMLVIKLHKWSLWFLSPSFGKRGWRTQHPGPSKSFSQEIPSWKCEVYVFNFLAGNIIIFMLYWYLSVVILNSLTIWLLLLLICFLIQGKFWLSELSVLLKFPPWLLTLTQTSEHVKLKFCCSWTA